MLTAASNSVFVRVASAVGAAPRLLPLSPSSTDDFVLATGFTSYPVVSWGDTIGKGLRFGFNNDYIGWHRPAGMSQDEVLLFVNHEDFHEQMVSGFSGGKKSKPQIEQEMASVGASILRLRRQQRRWQPIADAAENFRLDAQTEMSFSSGAKIAGQSKARGTLANCSGGTTPWGTFLTCEENYHDFWGDRAHGENAAPADPLQWRKLYDCPPEHYGWVVEYNPMTKSATKLVGLGRFKHEGALVIGGTNEPAVVYMGEDVAGGCIFKFVADRPRTLESGRLYVADIAGGKWIPLWRDAHNVLKEKFADDLQLMVHAAEAAKLVGGTPMDRPEGIAQHPVTGELFIALTNNAAKGNQFGSILKLKEGSGSYSGMSFSTETFLAGGASSLFACPDNLCFDRKGNLWFVTDISEKDMNQGAMSPFGNNSLFYVPMSGPDAGKILRIASAPIDAELTGPCFLDDGETLLVAVQHPGRRTTDLKNPTSRWNPNADGLPRSAVMAIQGPMMTHLLT
jgi:secreted PhoX family phosphatase